METLRQDIAYALRSLRRTPGFAATVILVIGLGIGVNSMMYSTLQPFLKVDMGFREPDRVMRLTANSIRTHDLDMGLSSPDYDDYMREARSFTSGVCWYETSLYPVFGADPERHVATQVTSGLCDVTGVRPVLGRWFTPDECIEGHQFGAVVLGYSVWKDRFGGDPNVIGRTLRANGRVRTIVGVMPKDFRFPEISDYFVPLALEPGKDSRGGHYVNSMVRLAPGVTAASANAELATICQRLEKRYPDTNTGIRGVVIPVNEYQVKDIRTVMTMLSLAVLFVLLIACANVANLTLARGATRHRELAIRLALGATRERLVRQLVTESVLLAFAGGLLGVLFGHWGLQLTLAAIPMELPYWMHFHTDVTVTVVTLVISLVSGVGFGLVPALQITAGELAAPLRDGSAGSGDAPARQRLRHGLVVAEVALALVLLVCSGLMVRSFLHVLQLRSTFRPDGLITASVTLPIAKYPEDGQKVAFMREYREAVAQLPGVTAVSGTMFLPLGNNAWNMSIARKGHQEDRADRMPVVGFAAVMPGYFETLGLKLARGRDFTDADVKGAPRVAIVNESAARRLWPGRDPLGQQFDFGVGDTLGPFTVIGVAHDLRQQLRNPRTEQMFVPHAQSPNQTIAFVVRTSGPPAALADPMRRLLRQRDPDLPLYDVRTMNEYLYRMSWEPRLYSGLMTTFSILALIIAALGIHGVMAYTVTQRTREIGIRMALGAARGDVQRMVVGQALRMVLWGAGIGLVVAFVSTRAMASLLQGVSPSDPPTYATVAALLALSGLIAAWLPARRATLVDPMLALRSD
jgi:putative ABC transport system permease protein